MFLLLSRVVWTCDLVWFVLAMYPAFAKWVQSHRDLPIKLNQWCNVVVSVLYKHTYTSQICICISSHLHFLHLLQSYVKSQSLWWICVQVAHFETLKSFSLPLSSFPILPLEVGVQTPPALPEDKGVPVAGRTHSLCHQRGGSWGGNTPGNLATISIFMKIYCS